MIDARRALVILSGLILSFGCKPENREKSSDKPRPDSIAVVLPSDPVALASLLQVPVDSLVAAGEQRYFRQEFDSARAIWRVELTRARAANNVAAEARVRMWLGLASYRLGDYVTARSEGENSLALKRQAGLDEELSRSFNGLGLVAWNEGRYNDALTLFDSAVVSATRNKDSAGIARAAGNIPLVRVELGDFSGARHGFERAIRLGREISDDRTHANGLDNLAMLEIRLGNASRAMDLLSEARRIYAKIEYTPGEANALGQRATALAALGDIQSAIAAADSSLQISRSEGLQQETASTLEVLADLQIQAGNPRLALRTLHQADSLDKQLGLTSERGINLRRTSTILLGLGESAPAVATAREALATHATVDARAERTADRTQLAEALISSGDLNGARAQTDTALREARTMNNPVAIREASLVAAAIALTNRDPRRALSLLAQIDVQEWSDWRVFDLRSQALLAIGLNSEAEEAAKRSISTLEREHAFLASGPLRSGYLKSKTAPFARLIAIYIAKKDTAAAFAIAAGIPGRALAESERTVAAPPPRAAGQLGASLAKIAALETEIGKLADSKSRAEQRTSLERALTSARLELRSDIAAHPSDGPQVQSLGRVTARLTNGEAVLLYVSGPHRVDCFAVRHSNVFYWSAAATDRDLFARVRVARAGVEGRTHRDAAVAALGRFHDLLIEPALGARSLASVSRISVVANGSLSALPFAALWNRRTRRFLIQDFEIASLPSLSYPSSVARRSPVGRTMIFAPFPDSLPGTGTEARAVSQLIPRSSLRVGRAVSERSIRSALAAGVSIHLASHGMHNAQNPLLSRLSVGRSVDNSPANDGVLEVHEILGMKTTSPLVFLSGCETALGSGSDGPFAQIGEDDSLAQAFLQSGTRAVVATLWRVNDRSAVTIAVDFYRNLKSGSSPQRSLAIVQRNAIARNGDLTWAAYALSQKGG